MTSFDTVVSNNLEEVRMIAGDEKVFSYTIRNEAGQLVNMTSACVVIFRYGEPESLVGTLDGHSITTGGFSATFSSGCSITLSGVYQQQVILIDSDGKKHVPAQGKIFIFPTPSI